MKGIFKQTGLLTLLALALGTVRADETEIYEASIDNKPQVLIILDTSRHMNNDTTFPMPERYDPNIDYSNPASNNVEKFFEDLFKKKHFYWRNYQEIKNLAPMSTLANIAGKEKLSPSEEALYAEFYATIPSDNDAKKRSYKYMNCASATFDMLNDLGAYTDHVRQWKGDGFFGLGAKWWKETISTDKNGVLYPKVDCKADMDSNNNRNPGAEDAAFFASEDGDTGDNNSVFYKGFPNNGINIPAGYGNNKQLNFAGQTEDQAYLYADNLVDWATLKRSGAETVELSYLNIAKKVVLDVMLETPEIKSGLEVFNANNTVFEGIDIANNHGGRVLSGIKSYDIKDYKANLLGYKNNISLLRNKVGGITTSVDARSALCESLYEGYHYLYGKEVWFGDDQKLFPYPKRDKSIEQDGKYIAPLDWAKTCQTEAYIIIVTAGYKNNNNDSDNFIKCQNHDGKANSMINTLSSVLKLAQPELTELDDSHPRSLSDQAHSDRTITTRMESAFGFNAPCDVQNKLPQLAHYLYNNDMNNNAKDGNQHIATYTVGVDVLDGSKALLQKTAEAGGGSFFNAESATQLREKLKLVFGDILARQKPTQAAITTSINSQNSTRSDKAVYFSMFEPTQTSKWHGNLKKLSIENGVLHAWNAPASGASSTDLTPALSATDGEFFADGLYSGWSNSPGLDDVDVGGVVEAFAKRSVSNPRKVYVNNDSDSMLCEITLENLKVVLDIINGRCINSDTPAGGPANLAASGDDLDEENAALAQALNVKVDGLDAVVNWLNGFNDTGTGFRDDIFGDPMHSTPLVVKYDNVSRIFIGTNAGFFHAFKDNGQTVEEEWAFIPARLLKGAISLRYDSELSNRFYGVDSSPIDAEYEDGKHIITVGLRRGGDAYYAFNVDKGITPGDAEKPKLHWLIENTDSGDFAKLGQTWSIPTVTKVFRGVGNVENDNPVLIFGGGYDASKDDCGINGSDSCADSLGRGIYIVDLLDKNLIKAFVFAGDCDVATQWDCIADSIAGKVSVLDSDNDGYSDRVYAADTGGNLYRVDIPRAFSGNSDNVDIAAWSLRLVAKLGHKFDDKLDRRFFTQPSIVRALDRNRTAYDGLLLGSGDVTHPNSNKVTEDYMFNIKDTDLSPVVWVASSAVATANYSVPAKARRAPVTFTDLSVISDSASSAYSTAGWAHELDKDPGQKILGNAVVIDGVVNFNSYSPFSNTVVVNNGASCLLAQTGNSHFYQVDLNSGSKKNYRKLENVIAKDLAVHADVNAAGEPVLRLLGAGKGESKTEDGVTTPTGTIDTKVTLTPRPIYRFMNEQ